MTLISDLALHLPFLWKEPFAANTNSKLHHDLQTYSD